MFYSKGKLLNILVYMFYSIKIKITIIIVFISLNFYLIIGETLVNEIFYWTCNWIEMTVGLLDAFYISFLCMFKETQFILFLYFYYGRRKWTSIYKTTQLLIVSSRLSPLYFFQKCMIWKLNIIINHGYHMTQY